VTNFGRAPTQEIALACIEWNAEQKDGCTSSLITGGGCSEENPCISFISDGPRLGYNSTFTHHWFVDVRWQLNTGGTPSLYFQHYKWLEGCDDRESESATFYAPPEKRCINGCEFESSCDGVNGGSRACEADPDTPTLTEYSPNIELCDEPDHDCEETSPGVFDCREPEDDQDCQDAEGNPCYPMTGNKSYLVSDYRSDSLEFHRTYHTAQDRTLFSYLGRGWSHNYAGYIETRDDGLNLITSNGRFHPFFEDGSGRFLSTLSGRRVIDEEGGFWVLKNGSTQKWYSQSTGLLAEIRDLDRPERSVQLLRDSQGQLLQVVDRKGRSLQFAYQNGLLSTVTTPDGVISFAHDSVSGADYELASVTYPDDASESYTYQRMDDRSLLTRVEGPWGGTKGVYAYDERGRVISSAPTETIPGVTLDYLSRNETLVTRPLGEEVLYNWTFFSEGWRGGAAASRVGGTSEFIEYADDSFVRPSAITRDGVRTEYEYDADFREIARREAVGEPEERVMTTSWNDTWFRKATEAAAGLQTDYVYDASGRVTEVIQTDVATGEVRATEYTYCQFVDPAAGCPLEGLLREIEAPGGRTTTFNYYLGNAGDLSYRTGDLSSVVNPVGHEIEYLEYDPSGRPLRIRDADGVETVMTYHARGWLLSRSIGSATTTFSYLPNGLVSRVTQPDGTYLDFEYDVAQRLEAIENALGERIEYDLDAAGNRTAERILDASDTLRHEISRVYDQLGRLDAMINGLSHQTDYDYDAASNLSDVTDPLNNSTGHDYDPLNRLEKTLDALGGETGFNYDESDNLTEVTDPEGLTTSYSYNAFGDLIELDSPDTGVTTYSYDSAGNRTSQTDARGVTATFTYDPLNRLLSAQYSDSSLNVSYFYDEPNSVTGCKSSYPIGRLTRLVDASGTTTWCYDELGNVLVKNQSNASLSVSYTYSAAGRMQTMTLPSGHRVSYKRDADGEISEITVGSKNGARPSAFVSAIERAPFGPVEEIQFGSGSILSFALDANYQVTGVSSEGLDLSFDRDPVGNIVDLLDPVLQSPVEQYDYDNLYRLEEVADAGGAIFESYTYDLIGNRQQKQSASGLETYTYPLDSHRLIEVGPDLRTYDAMGNMLSRQSGSETFTYDQRGRLVQYSGFGQTTNYTHNGLGQRVGKVIQASFPQQASYFLYDESGRLLSEYRPVQMGLGVYPWREYIWTDDRLVGVIDELGNIHEVHTDHLGTPRAVVADDGTLLWTWQFDQNPFGEALPNEDPASTGNLFELNLRFPGQYYDAESGLHYNYFRDYEAGVGRYVQSDPIGLRGGLATYAYSLNSPLHYFDWTGLSPFADNNSPLMNFCLDPVSCYCNAIGGCNGSDFDSGLISCIGKCVANLILSQWNSVWQGPLLKRAGALATHVGKRGLWVMTAVDFARCKSECDSDIACP